VPGQGFAHTILARIKPTLLSHRRPQRSGFTPGRSTCDRIATLCNIAQQRQDFGHPTFAAFVDLSAAFDSLSRPALWLLLTRFGIPDKIVRLFRVLYHNSVSSVQTGGSHSSWFKIEAGVPRIHLPQAWIGCWTGLLNLARSMWRLARAPSLIWILLTMSLSLLNCWSFLFPYWRQWQVSQHPQGSRWIGRRQKYKLWEFGWQGGWAVNH